jgi:putative inorganic carbon (hco3(-)) transporter
VARQSPHAPPAGRLTLMTSAAPLGRWWWPSLAIAAAASVGAATALGQTEPAQLFEWACVSLVLVGAGYLIWHIDPAWTVSAALALTVFSGNWQHLGLPGFPFLPDRLLLASGIAALLLRAPGARDRPRFERNKVHWLLAFAAAYAAIDAFASDTLTTNSGFFKLTDRFGVIPFVLFALGPILYRTARQRNILLGFLVGTGAYLGLTALFETLNLTGLIVPRYIVNPAIGLSDINSQGVAIGRARGPFLDAVSNGLAMFDCGVAAALALVLWRGRWQRVLASAVIILCALGCLFTLQRTIWLATVAGVLAAMIWNTRLRRHVVPAVVGGVVLVAFAFALIPGLSQRASTRLNDNFTVWDRQNLTAAGVRMLAARPLLGFGWDRFASEEDPYLIQPATYPLVAHGRVIHNTFLSNAVELGILGALVWVVAMAAALIAPLRRRGPPVWRTSLVAVAVFWAVTAWLYPLPLAFPLTFVMLWAGIVYGTAGVPAAAPAGGAASRRALRVGAAGRAEIGTA